MVDGRIEKGTGGRETAGVGGGSGEERAVGRRREGGGGEESNVRAGGRQAEVKPLAV